MVSQRSMTDDELAVLSALPRTDELATPFAPIMQETGLDRERVRAACRSLRARGLAEFYRGLWTDCLEPAGSGYGLTKAGLAALDAIEAWQGWWPAVCDCGRTRPVFGWHEASRAAVLDRLMAEDAEHL